MNNIVLISGVCPWNNDGALGWRRKHANAEHYDFSNYSLGLAHDIMEHFDQETIEDEAKSHGAELWLRGESNFILDVPQGVKEKSPHILDWNARRDYRALNVNIAILAKYDEKHFKDIDIQPNMSDWAERQLFFVQPSLTRLGFDCDNYNNWLRLGYHQVIERYKNIGRDKACKTYQNLVYFFENSLKLIKPHQEMLIVI